MTNQEEFQFELIAEKRSAEVETKAKQYFYKQKKRMPYYDLSIANANNFDEEVTVEHYCSEEEFAQLSQHLIDAFNKKFPSQGPITTIDELNKERCIYELHGIDPMIDKFLLSDGERGITVTEIGPTPHYLYNMSYYFWNSTTERMSKRNRFSVELTDDEYIYLLTEQLLYRSPNTYNRLFFSNPDLAMKICAGAENPFSGDDDIRDVPYLIIFDELLEDAEVIDGPVSVNEQIYDDGDFPANYSISGHTRGRLLSICEEDEFQARSHSLLRELKDIDADKVQKLLGARNYAQMLYAMRSLCTSPSPFDAIKEWLDKEHLSYTESTVQKK